MPIALHRRRFNCALLSLAALAAAPIAALGRNRAAFQATRADAALRALFAGKPLVAGENLDFRAPEIAEDGSIVPVTVSAPMPGVRSISLLVDANPNPLSARFHFHEGAVAQFRTRIKMGESSDVRAVVETDDALYVATRRVKVTLGGCGG